MSSTQEVRQVQDRQVAVSDDDFALMDYTDPEKDPESGAEEAGTQTDIGKRHWGRCRRRKFMRRQMEMEGGDCHFRSHHHEKKMMKKMAKKWMKKMMWRRMMFRMCYGGPLGMGGGFGCPRRMRMMAAAMMDSTDTSSSESGDKQEYGGKWRRRRCCRGRKFGRRFGEGKGPEDQTTEKGKNHIVELQDENTEKINQNANQNASTSKDTVSIQTTTTENEPSQTESAASGRVHEKKDRRKEYKKWKRMRKVHFCDMSSSSSSSSSSSESSSDENEPAQEVTKSKDHGGRHWRRGGRHHHYQVASAEGIEDEKGDKCTKGRRAWKGRKFHKKMMKGMGRRGYFRRFY